ncbi:selenoprotein S-like [Tubulanus polymorphus]|uniref:selenoprotein S-like n=1 Tax=Tubulanus polymorphus TaxID=672921 RepID=UPI003DA471D0
MADFADAFDHRELEDEVNMDRQEVPDAEVHVEPDDVGFDAQQHQDVNVNLDWYSTAVILIKSYGWYIVLAVVAVAFLKNRYEHKFRNLMFWKRKKKNEGLQYDADTALKRQEAMENTRRRWQEQHDAQAARFAEEQRKKEDEKRKDKIDDWDRHQRGEGYRSKVYKPKEEEPGTSTSQTVNPKKTKSKPLRKPEYNPLSGAGNDGFCYRPSRFGGGGVGGG